jgi:hypothetical protein
MSEQARSARAIADALFKPKPAATEDHLVEHAIVRHPRILNVEPRRDAGLREEAAPERVMDTTEYRSAGIPRSQHARIQTLATYGMSISQVAELYEATVDEIERIVEG